MIEGCKGEKKDPPKKVGVKINFGKGKKGASSKGASKKESPKTVEKTPDTIDSLDIKGYSDDEEGDVEVSAAEKTAEGLEFYRRQSQQLKEKADTIERQFSLNKSVAEDKIPELLKRKTSLQQNLENQMGSVQKIRNIKLQQWEVPQDVVTGKDEDGQEFELRIPQTKQEEFAKLEKYRQESFEQLYELEKPYEGRPSARSEAAAKKAKLLSMGLKQEDEETKE